MEKWLCFTALIVFGQSVLAEPPCEVAARSFAEHVVALSDANTNGLGLDRFLGADGVTYRYSVREDYESRAFELAVEMKDLERGCIPVGFKWVSAPF